MRVQFTIDFEGSQNGELKFSGPQSSEKQKLFMKELQQLKDQADKLDKDADGQCAVRAHHTRIQMRRNLWCDPVWRQKWGLAPGSQSVRALRSDVR